MEKYNQVCQLLQESWKDRLKYAAKSGAIGAGFGAAVGGAVGASKYQRLVDKALKSKGLTRAKATPEQLKAARTSAKKAIAAGIAGGAVGGGAVGAVAGGMRSGNKSGKIPSEKELRKQGIYLDKANLDKANLD